MDPSESYELFRHLTSPIMALTCAWDGKRNGMILNSAIRASLIPTKPRAAVFILKKHLTHGMLMNAGAFGLHFLHRDNWELIWELGFHSGRDRDKLAGFDHRIGITGSPLLADAYARLDCRIINAMDTGASTCFLGEVIAVERGAGEAIMTSDHFRAHMPADWYALYEEQLVEVQEWAAGMADRLRPLVWKGLEP